MSHMRRQHGFSLVELMVGVVIGLISSVVILGVFSTYEREKRTITGVADAQTNGAIALYMVERDVKMAGWGLESSTFKNCTNIFSYFDDGISPAGPVGGLFTSAIIKDGGTTPDEITIQYYTNPADKTFRFSVTTLRSTMPQPSSELNVTSTYGCEQGDLAIIQQDNNCTLMEITQVQPEALKLQHNPGGTPTYNPPVPYQTANGWPAYTAGANLQCFSPRLHKRIYRINARNLEFSEPNNAGTMQTYQTAPEIIDMQAQYGVADAGKQDISGWAAPTGMWAHNMIGTTDMRRIKALRIALVARGAYEKPDASGNCTATDASTVSDWSPWATFNTSGYPGDWQCYRYKVYETVVPLTNIIWAKL